MEGRKGGCEKSAVYREKMAVYVQYWEDIIAELEVETVLQAPTVLQFGFWPSTD
jgi:hypothetical protein